MAIEAQTIFQKHEEQVIYYVPKPGDVLQGESRVYQGYGPQAPFIVDRVLFVINQINDTGEVDAEICGPNPASPEKEWKSWKCPTTQEQLKNGKYGQYSLSLLYSASGE